LAIGDLNLTEVLQGLHNERDFHTARKLLTRLAVVESGGQEIAIQAAKKFSRAAEDGRDRSQNDRHDYCDSMHRERI
jgi:hypothetical protein